MATDNWEQLVTLVIPTVHHRVHLFTKALAYLDLARFKCPVIVSDHSPPGSHDVIKVAIAKYQNLNTELIYHDPDIHFLERLADCAERSGTPYFQLHADDDFLSQEGLKRGCVFLQNHPEYSACHGDTLRISWNNETLKLRRKWSFFQNRRSNLIDRIYTQLMCYSSVLYALRRTKEVVKTFRDTVSHCTDDIFWQYLETIFCCVQGKIEVMNFPWYFRTVHPTKWSSKTWNEPFGAIKDFPFLLFQPEFSSNFHAFVKAVTQRLGMHEFYHRTRSELTAEDFTLFSGINNAFAEFIFSRVNYERTGQAFMKLNGNFRPSLEDLYMNCTTIPDYATVLTTIEHTRTGHSPKQIRIAKSTDPSIVLVKYD